jgi:hypothetical protein
MRKLSQLVILSALLYGGTALAGRPVAEFKPPAEMSEEERAKLKAQQLGGNINAYGKDVQIKETPVPWAAIGLAGLIFLVATPFAIRAYRSTTKEIVDTNPSAARAGGGDDDES